MSTPYKMKGHTLPGPMQKKGEVNPFSAEYKRMTKSQRTAKYGEGYKKIGSGKEAINRENVAVSLGKLDTKIKGALNKIDKTIKGPEGGSYLAVSKGSKGISIKNTPGVNPNPDGGNKKTKTDRVDDLKQKLVINKLIKIPKKLKKSIKLLKNLKQQLKNGIKKIKNKKK